MKRVFLGICSVVLVFSLTACGASDAQSSSSSVVLIEATDNSAYSSAPVPLEGSENSTQDNTPTPPTQDTTPPEPTLPTPPTQDTTPPVNTNNPNDLEEEAVRNIQVTIGDKVFSATLEENKAATSFAQMLQNAPISISMSDYSGFEKVGSLGTNLPESNRSITAQAGDIILYNGNQICVFYGSNSWSYTKLGKIDDLSGWAETLGSGDITLTFSII